MIYYIEGDDDIQETGSYTDMHQLISLADKQQILAFYGASNQTCQSHLAIYQREQQQHKNIKNGKIREQYAVLSQWLQTQLKRPYTAKCFDEYLAQSNGIISICFQHKNQLILGLIKKQQHKKVERQFYAGIGIVGLQEWFETDSAANTLEIIVTGKDNMLFENGIRVIRQRNDIISKGRRGGQSSQRFQRIADEQRHGCLVKFTDELFDFLNDIVIYDTICIYGQQNHINALLARFRADLQPKTRQLYYSVTQYTDLSRIRQQNLQKINIQTTYQQQTNRVVEQLQHAIETNRASYIQININDVYKPSLLLGLLLLELDRYSLVLFDSSVLNGEFSSKSIGLLKLIEHLEQISSEVSIGASRVLQYEPGNQNSSYLLNNGYITIVPKYLDYAEVVDFIRKNNIKEHAAALLELYKNAIFDDNFDTNEPLSITEGIRAVGPQNEVPIPVSHN